MVRALALLALASGVLALSLAVRLLIGSPAVSAVLLGVVTFGGLGILLVGTGIGLAWWGWRPT